jgi:hypothetical protein
MSREPHGPVRRLSMLIVAVPLIWIGSWLCYTFWTSEGLVEDRSSRYSERVPTAAGVGAVLAIIGLRFVYTALTPYRPRTQEEEDAEGEYPYSWSDRRRLKQWGDGHKVGPPPWHDDW